MLSLLLSLIPVYAPVYKNHCINEMYGRNKDLISLNVIYYWYKGFSI